MYLYMKKADGFGYVKFTIKSGAFVRRLILVVAVVSPPFGSTVEIFPSGWLILSPGAIKGKTF